MNGECFSLFVTHVDTCGSGRFLKVFGQRNQDVGIAIETAISSLKNSIRTPLNSAQIPVQTLCLAKYTDDHFYRSKVLGHVNAGAVIVNFLDYGNDEIISLQDIGILEERNPSHKELMNIPPQVEEFILSGVVSQNWTETELIEIRAEITNETVKAEVVNLIDKLILIKVMKGSSDFSEILAINKKMGQIIGKYSQEDKLSALYDFKPAIPAAFTSNILPVGSEYKVMVCHIQDGPFLFYIQLLDQVEELSNLTTSLRKLELEVLNKKPVVGLACLAYSHKTESVQRVMITHVATTACVVRFVDFGNTEIVPIHELYDIPKELLKVKLFAIKFCLAGSKVLDRTNQVMREKFSHLVLNPEDPVEMTVVPIEGNPNLHYCDLKSGETEVCDNLFKTQKKSMTYGEMEPLVTDFVGTVRVLQATDPKRFFVQLPSQADYLRKISRNLKKYLEKSRPLMNELRIGAVCAVNVDGEWYRGEITDIIKAADGNTNLLMNCVDTGRDVEVDLTKTRKLNYELTLTPPISFECCLYGVDKTSETTARFIKCLNLSQKPDRMFQIRVHNRITYKSYLVDLMDENRRIVINDLIKDSSKDLNIDKYYQMSPEINGISESTLIYNNIEALKEKSETEIVVCSWFSPHEFYVQLKVNQSQLSTLSKQIQKCQKSLINKPPSGNHLVIVKYHKTGIFYRASIEDYNEKMEKFKVLLVDCGIKTIVNMNQVFQADDPVLKAPRMSTKCCLYSKSKIYESEKQLESVSAIIKSAKSTKCFLQDVKDEIHRVSVYVDGNDLFDLLLQEGLIEVEKQKSQEKDDKPFSNDMVINDENIIEGEKLSVTVSAGPDHAINRMFVQKIDTLRQITKMHMDLRDVCENNSNVLTIEMVESSDLLAVKAKDTHWYRGKVIRHLKDSTFEFKLVDYGRDEQITLPNIRKLPPKFQNIEKMAIEVFVPFQKFSDRVPDDTIKAEVVNLTKDISIILQVIEVYRGCLIVDLISNGFYLDHALRDRKFGIRCDVQVIRDQIDSLLGVKVEKNSIQKEAVEISHFDNPERIFVQMKTDLPRLKELQENIQIVAPSLKSMPAPKVGELCIVCNSFDTMWYRARILDYAPDITTVQFIDYGNTDVITEKQNQVKEILSEFEKIEPFAKFCSLSMKPIKGRSEWDEKVLEIFNNIMMKSITECHFLTKTKTDKHFVKLFIDGEELENILIRQNLGLYHDLILSDSICYVSHINSLSDFYIQLEKDAKALDLFSEYFSKAETFPDIGDDFEVGKICAGQFLEDNGWYRVKILSEKRSSNSMVEVQFIDFGNIAEVKCLKRMSNEIADLPIMTKQCQLNVPKTILNFSAEAENKFVEIAQQGATVMKVILVAVERDYFVVELLRADNGKNILSELVPNFHE